MHGRPTWERYDSRYVGVRGRSPQTLEKFYILQNFCQIFMNFNIILILNGTLMHSQKKTTFLILSLKKYEIFIDFFA